MPKDMKYHDVGQMRSRPDITAEKDETQEKHYPGQTYNEKQLPFLKGKKQGDTGVMCVKYRGTGTREAEEWDDSDADHYSLEYKAIGEYK